MQRGAIPCPDVCVGGAFGLGLPVSNQRAALAITRDYKWELYSIKIDSRVN